MKDGASHDAEVSPGISSENDKDEEDRVESV